MPDPFSYQNEPPSRPPMRKAPSGLAKVWGGFLLTLAMIGKLLASFGKIGLLFLGKLKYLWVVLKTGGTMLLSIGAYALIYPWQFAVGFVLLIFIHELGHVIAARMMRLPVSAPVFIPFLGAQILLKEMPRNAWVEAVVGIGGPLLGTLGAFLCYLLAESTGDKLYFVLAYSGFFLNLFNMVPIIPLDGGRIVTAFAPWLWILGLVVIVPYLLWNASAVTIYILIIIAFSIPRVWSMFKNRNDPENRRYYECTGGERWTMGILYFGLIACLGLMMHICDEKLSGPISSRVTASQVEDE